MFDAVINLKVCVEGFILSQDAKVWFNASNLLYFAYKKPNHYKKFSTRFLFSSNNRFLFSDL